jgi:hypothetical protein
LVEEAKELGLAGAARLDSFEDNGNKYGLLILLRLPCFLMG